MYFMSQDSNTETRSQRFCDTRKKLKNTENQHCLSLQL